MVKDGHFYSPIPDLDYVEKNKTTLFNRRGDIQDIKLGMISQRLLLYDLAKNYSKIQFRRFFVPNGAFPIGDAVILQLMLLHFKPKRAVEVGCGFSSAVFLDTKEFFLPEIDLSLIEPNPACLFSVLKDRDKPNIYKSILQEVNYKEIFGKLESGDIAFFDTSHVSKIGSELHTIFFEILPILKPGVIIHFHDMFYPFEYPIEWVQNGVYWNEAYMLRAFLMNNQKYEILYWNNYMRIFQEEAIKELIPDCLKNAGGSIWLIKR